MCCHTPVGTQTQLLNRVQGWGRWYSRAPPVLGSYIDNDGDHDRNAPSQTNWVRGYSSIILEKGFHRVRVRVSIYIFRFEI